MMKRCSWIVGLLALAPGLAACTSSLQEGQERRGLAWWIWLIIIVAALAVYRLLTRRRYDELVDRSTHEPPPRPKEIRVPADEEQVVVEERADASVIPEPAPSRTPTGAPDDLKVVEGIGPKVEQVLAAAGITTFAGLAGTGAGRLVDILREAGLRFMDPTTWPDQARLAAAGRWEELKALQQGLKGGRRA